ncbi:DUF2691 family protein [Metabacillus elymi]|uniref:DUF2691 family protein n=1 Tax=Metabacillus elymi TaxID=2745198 RepID=A0ABX6S798_9BACI|nr:DUF2691 family protein [Metabacillus sp. KUDC1714]QNF29643.1 DUF2691 family protein [Metabacillus sp. KUDC1714]
MKRGISFEIPNKYGSFLGEVLQPLEITEFIWLSGGEESYLVEDDELRKPLFTDEINWMDGLLLKELLEDNKYYLIFVDLKAYSKGKNPAYIETYKDFLNSDCELILLVVDSVYVTIYCKDSEKLEAFYDNVKKKGFDNLQYITDKNDTRIKFSV